jgi:hypothetical protein
MAITARTITEKPIAAACNNAKLMSKLLYRLARTPTARARITPIVSPAQACTKKGRPARDLPLFSGGYGFRSSGVPISPGRT